MCEAASHKFWLSEPLKGSELSRKDHFEGIWKQTGEKPPELDGPEFPDVAEHVWHWFIKLYNGERITYQEIKAWSELTGTQIESWEVEAIKRIELEKIKTD